MTEQRAAYEAATIEAMHTGDYAALTAYTRTAAEVEPEPPDLEYTPITDPLPELVRPAEVAELRARVAELEGERMIVADRVRAYVLAHDAYSRDWLREWVRKYVKAVQP